MEVVFMGRVGAPIDNDIKIDRKKPQTYRKNLYTQEEEEAPLAARGIQFQLPL
jgi:hypothetical protein